jgi:hypothetical protein
MGRFKANKVDKDGKVIKKFKEWKKANPDALYHDSKMEYEFYTLLSKKKIKFDYQQKFILQPSFKFTDYVTRSKKGVKTTDWYSCSVQPITWSPDFLLVDHNLIIECKGRENDAFPNKLKMFKYHVHQNKLGLRVIVMYSLKELEQFLNKLNGGRD